jgi:hypothetical protein
VEPEVLVLGAEFVHGDVGRIDWQPSGAVEP